MLGKGALIYVVGVAMLFSFYTVKMNKFAVQTSDHFLAQYIGTLNHESAMSGMNMGINEVWANNTTNATFMVIQPPCTTNVTISPLGSDTVIVKAIARTRVYDADYYAVHSTRQQILDSSFAIFTSKTPLTAFCYFTNKDYGQKWEAGDTAWAAVHTNHLLHAKDGVFYGKVTALKNIAPKPTAGGTDAEYHAGWEVGINSPLPTASLATLHWVAILSNGLNPMNSKCLYDSELKLHFLANGNVVRTVGAGVPDTVALATIAPHGVIVSSENIRVSGVVNGQITIHSNKTVYIDGDLTYANDPLTDPLSDDIIGLTADVDVLITNNAANSDGVTIYAAIFAVREFQSQAGNSGVLRFVGSIAQDYRTTIVGYTRWTGYDPRFRTMSPPYYPKINGVLRLVTWWE